VVAQCIALLAQVGSLLGPVETLSADEIRRALKLRKGGVQVITQVFDLCTHHGITTVGPLTARAMSSQLARATALNQIAVEIEAVQKKLTDASFSAESLAWQYATAFYTVLQRIALVDPTLAAGLQPIQAFFQTKKTKGTMRATKAASDLRKAEQKAARNRKAAPAEPAPAANGTGNSAGAFPGGANGAAPAAPAVPAATGGARS
jgi:hypothetical protein